MVDNREKARVPRVNSQGEHVNPTMKGPMQDLNRAFLLWGKKANHYTTIQPANVSFEKPWPSPCKITTFNIVKCYVFILIDCLNLFPYLFFTF